jgi:hypothetical protein
VGTQNERAATVSLLKKHIGSFCKKKEHGLSRHQLRNIEISSSMRIVLALLSLSFVLSTAAADTVGASIPQRRLYFAKYEGQRGAYVGYLEWIPASSPGTIHRVVRFQWPAALQAVSTGGGHLFWAAGSVWGTLSRGRLDGTQARRLVSGIRDAAGVAVAGNYVYWIALKGIGRAEVTGKQLHRRFVVPSQESFGGVGQGLVTDGRYLYFTRCDEESIARVGLDGRGLNLRFIQLNGCPQSLAYAAGYLYWAGFSPFIGRATTDRSRVEPHWLNVHGAGALAGDSKDIFWTWGTGGGAPSYIGHATADGKNVTLRFMQGVDPIYLSP